MITTLARFGSPELVLAYLVLSFSISILALIRKQANTSMYSPDLVLGLLVNVCLFAELIYRLWAALLGGAK
jgi:hypothetical protein